MDKREAFKVILLDILSEENFESRLMSLRIAKGYKPLSVDGVEAKHEEDIKRVKKLKEAYSTLFDE